MNRCSLLVAIICVGLCSLVQSRILGIDIGSRRIRSVMVHGGRPFEIVLDETSKRNAPVLIGFDDEERRFGNSAKRLASRKPDRSFMFMMRLLGRPYDCPEMKQFADEYFGYEFERTERGTIAVKFQDTSYTVEELIAMTLRYVKNLAEDSLNEEVSKKMNSRLTISGAVLTVPVHFTPQQRQALHDASEVAGLHVLAITNEDFAAAVQFGISRKYNASEVHNVAFFNMGASSTSVTLTKFSSYVKVTGFRSNQTIGQFEVLGQAYDKTLGDQRLEVSLVEHLADGFTRQLEAKGIKDDIRKVPRVMARLKQAAQSTKEILSANAKFPVRIEALHEDIDFHMDMTRDELISLGKETLDRIPSVIESALKNAKLSAEDLDSFVLIGGGSRIPRVQELIRTTLDRDELNQNLDADEAMAFGAAFMAANMSKSFRVRKFGAISRMQYPIGARLANLEGAEPLTEDEKAWSKRASVFSKMSSTGKKRHVTLKHDHDVVVKLQIDDLEAENPDLCQFEVTGVAEAVNELKEKGEPQLQLTFEGTMDGRATLEQAVVIVEETVLVPEEKSKKPKKKAKASDEADKDSDKKDDGNVKDEESSETKDEQKSGENDDKDVKDEEEAPKMKEVKRKHRRMLNIAKKPAGDIVYMSADDVTKSKKALQKLDDADKWVRDIAKAKNDLEAYIYETRSRMRDDDVAEVSEESVRNELIEKLGESEDWIYDDHENESPTMFIERLNSHRVVSSPILERVHEAAERPKALATAHTQLAVTEGEIERMRQKMEWIPSAKVDDLEKLLKEVRSWISEKSDEQNARKPHEEPVLRAADVVDRVAPLLKKSAKLLRIPKPKPKPTPKPANATDTANATDGAEAKEQSTGADDKPKSDEAAAEAGGAEEGKTSESGEAAEASATEEPVEGSDSHSEL